MRSDARHNESAALGHARREGMALGAEQERTKWESVVSDKEAALADKDARIAKLLAQLGEDKQIANME